MNRIIVKIDRDGCVSAYGSLSRLFESDPEADALKHNIRYAIIKKNRPYRKEGIQVIRVNLNQHHTHNHPPKCLDGEAELIAIGIPKQEIENEGN